MGRCFRLRECTSSDSGSIAVVLSFGLYDFMLQSIVWKSALMVCMLFGLAVDSAANAQQAGKVATRTSDDRLSELTDSLNRQLDSIEQSSESSGKPSTNGIAAIRLAIGAVPAGRHRYVMPTTNAKAKGAAEALWKEIGSTPEGEGLRSDLLKYAERLEEMADATGAASSTSIGMTSSGPALTYVSRWRAAGIRTMLPLPAEMRKKDVSGWEEARSIGAMKTAPRAAHNLAGVGWAAGSYALISTPHFEIASQAGDKTAAELAELCELAYAVWRCEFYSYWAGSNGRAVPESDRKFTVVLFRDRDAYIKALKTIEPNIGISTGYYSPGQRKAFFYWDRQKTASTVVHELTHQFFSEAGRDEVSIDPDDGEDFWVIEGIALYMESLSTRTCGGAWVVEVGGWDASRLQAGRYRLLHDQQWIPWDRFRSATGKQFRQNKEAPEWYSQACGLTHWFMDSSDQERSKFEAYLDAIYHGGQGATEFAAGIENKKLLEDYFAFLVQSPTEKADGKWLPRPFYSNRRDAVLSRCAVTSDQVLSWPVEYRAAGWLDLSFTEIDDRMFGEAGDAVWNVQRLNLESTKITDASMPAIAAMKGLEDLDLSKCDVTDEGLLALRDHKTLRILWLAETKLTDKAIEVLSSLPALESLQVPGTEITKAGWTRLMQAKPRLKSKSNGPS